MEMKNIKKIIFKIGNLNIKSFFNKSFLCSFWEHITNSYSPKEQISLTWVKQKTYEMVTYFCQNNKDEFLNTLNKLEEKIKMSDIQETQINNNNNETYTKKGIVHYED